MSTLTIGGRECKVKATYGHFSKLMKMYPDMDKMTEWSIAKYNQFVFDAVWLILERVHIFKPYVFKRRMMKEITIPELKSVQVSIHNILLGEEDKEPGK